MTGQRSRKHARGAALAETAIVFVVFTLMIFGIIDGGRMMWEYNILSYSAREGVRYASMRGSTNTHPATASDVQNYVTSQALGLGVSTAVSWSPNNQPGSTVQVTTTHAFTPIFVPLSPSITLRSSSKMAIVR